MATDVEQGTAAVIGVVEVGLLPVGVVGDEGPGVWRRSRWRAAGWPGCRRRRPSASPGSLVALVCRAWVVGGGGLAPGIGVGDDPAELVDGGADRAGWIADGCLQRVGQGCIRSAAGTVVVGDDPGG